MNATNTALLHRFYTAFQARDGAAMGACYHPDASFHDHAFQLEGAVRITGMWTMLTQAGKDLEIIYSDVQADEKQGSAYWEARYTFGATGRRVHNTVWSSFEFRDGLIYRQRDDFPFARWARQALGLPGLLMGWTPFLKKKVSATAMGKLDKFLAKQAT
jgi:ketosteroid isomerase-like protein